jgi:hypothetical protein
MSRPKSFRSRRAFLATSAAAPLALAAAPGAPAAPNVAPSPAPKFAFTNRSLSRAELMLLDEEIEDQLAVVDEALAELRIGAYDRNGPGWPDAEPYNVEVMLSDDLGTFHMDAREPLAPQFIAGLEAVATRLMAFAEAIRAQDEAEAGADD